MAVGKNKIARWFTFSFDDSTGNLRDLTTDLVPESLGPVGGLTFDEVLMHGVGEAVKNFLASWGNSEIGAKFFMNDTATTGAFTVLNGMNGKVGTLTLKYGSGAAPTTGDQSWTGEYVLLQAPVVADSGRLVLDCKFKPSGATAPAFVTL